MSPPSAVSLPSPDDVAETVDEMWRALEVRASRRHGGGYSAGYRCWSCRLFVSGPTVTCSHCGNPHGGIHHEAYASR